MAKKKAKDLTPKGNDVKGGVMDRDVAGPGGRDVRRLKRGLQKT